MINSKKLTVGSSILLESSVITTPLIPVICAHE